MKYSESFHEKLCCLMLLAVFAMNPGSTFAQNAQEETYSMDFVQTAEPDKEILEVEDKKVLTENYTVREGDHLWQIFRERGLLEKGNLNELISVLKRINRSLENMDLIHPGQSIIIPLKISPVAGKYASVKNSVSTPMNIRELKYVDIKDYTIRPGDSIIKVVTELNNAPPKDLWDEYLKVLKDLNPSIENPDTIYPGQIVRLPIYSPKVVRMPIEPRPVSTEESPAGIEESKEVISRLAEIFTLMGEEWINSGKHFIPLRTGGQISLNAETYPVINLVNGNKIIVDTNNDLSEKISSLIKSNWDNYRIVNLEKGNDLRQAFDKIISACGFHSIYRKGEPFKIDGDISITIKADWIIKYAYDQPEGKTGLIVLNIPAGGSRIPPSILTYLKGIGVKVIEYPVKETHQDQEEEMDLFYPHEKRSIIEILLELEGLGYSSDLEIPIHQGNQDDFRLIIEADFLLDMDGRHVIIDTSGIGEEVISLLEEHQYRVLQLSMKDAPSNILKQALDFLNIKYELSPHVLPAADRDGENNIFLDIPGIVFLDKEAKNIFATPLNLSGDISRFLTSRGYRIMILGQVSS